MDYKSQSNITYTNKYEVWHKVASFETENDAVNVIQSICGFDKSGFPKEPYVINKTQVSNF